MNQTEPGRWQAGKIGLLNFWYYDEQEFPFEKGRILLRGSNGSGKSVTMQSVVPLLLDGNMSPERLDPFGSRDRKMTSYLLEEDDKREERTGYLYLEFAKKCSPETITIGMGIRARKGKPLDKWYFALTDGRRIGKEFFLYKEMQDRLPLSKKELENRIGAGGRVFDRQADYMEFVNSHIFGFASVQEYKELIDLLIQLRTPKLSKDFKPTVVNDILSSALQPISDEELRPMAEAIENMDSQSMSLKQRESAKMAAERITRAYGRYNTFMLYEKARLAAEKKRLCDRTARDISEGKAKKEELSRALDKLVEEMETLQSQHEAMEKERDTLRDSGAVTLKKKQLELIKEKQQFSQSTGKKEMRLDRQKEQQTDTLTQLDQRRDGLYRQEKAVRSELEEMAELAAEMEFDEHRFLADALMAQVEEQTQRAVRDVYETQLEYVAEDNETKYDSIGWDSHIKQAEKKKTLFSEGLQLLEQLEEKNKEANRLYRLQSEVEKKTDGKRRELGIHEQKMIDAQGNYVEAIHRWNQTNAQLKLSTEEVGQIVRFAQEYDAASDPTAMREMVSDIKTRRALELEKNKAVLLAEKEEKTMMSAALLEELRQWEADKEAEPSLDEAAVRNREWLTSQGIPFDRLYRLLEYPPDMPKEKRALVEEALMRMGILDALVIDEIYKEQVLASPDGAADRYLFGGMKAQGETLLDHLSFGSGADDLFINQRLTGILGQIRWRSQAPNASASEKIGKASVDTGYPLAEVVADDKACFRIGPVTGTVTGTYEAQYIGREAREQARQTYIHMLKEQIGELDREVESLSGQINVLEQHLTDLAEEFMRMPSTAELRIAWGAIADCREAIEKLEREMADLSASRQKILDETKASRQKVTQLAAQLYVECKKDVFDRAYEACREYIGRCRVLRSSYDRFVLGCQSVEDTIEKLQSIAYDMDTIMAELHELKLRTRRVTDELASVEEQLRVIKADAVEERLEACLQWLADYPDRMQRCATQTGSYKEQLAILGHELEQLVAQQAERDRQFALSVNYFQEEYALGYSTIYGLEEDIEGKPQDGTEDPNQSELLLGAKGVNGRTGDEKEDMARIASCAKEVALQLADTCRDWTKERLIGELNDVFHGNKGYLTDYQLTQKELFFDRENVGEYAPVRIDLEARYNGQKIPFIRLLRYLEEEIEELRLLLKDSDRQLFEDILANTVSRRIRSKINSSHAWVEEMNRLMGNMDTSSGLKLRLRWRSRTAEVEEQLDTQELVRLLSKDYLLQTDEDQKKLSGHFRSKVEHARRRMSDGNGTLSFYQMMRDTLDYRKWFEFQILYRKGDDREKELTNSVFGTFSGGEKAMSMYVPLFSAVAAKYQSGNGKAPRLLSLDEAFAGVDNRNIRDMFRLMSELDFDFIINSQVLWGDSDTLDALAIYQLIRPDNAKYVTVMSYMWNGHARIEAQ